jgi:hypothetical protein
MASSNVLGDGDKERRSYLPFFLARNVMCNRYQEMMRNTVLYGYTHICLSTTLMKMLSEIPIVWVLAPPSYGGKFVPYWKIDMLLLPNWICKAK